MKNTLVITLLAIVLSSTTYAQSDQEYGETLTEMFEVSGSKGAYDAAISQMLNIFREQYAEVSKEIWDGLEADFKKTSMTELSEMLIPVYQKYMTIDDLKELIKFYNSPVGKKYAKNTPDIVQESIQIGQQWGMKIGEEFARKMKDQGY